MSLELDGNMSLSDTTNACVVHQNSGLQLESIEFDNKVHNGRVFLINKTSFKLKPVGRLKILSFVEIKDADNPATVKKTNEDAGWTFICDKQIYVVDKLTRVMVFGRKS